MRRLKMMGLGILDTHLMKKECYPLATVVLSKALT